MTRSTLFVCWWSLERAVLAGEQKPGSVCLQEGDALYDLAYYVYAD